ncbi:MAG TPA: TetR/AcrR family transcriptional regulator [Phenylobacterium sp.]|uniref:TetR/AcrR family transcriptional regulator n=1 Tax=Phenylobacterium sp. TaxID=1871053 RepID=UPI002D36236D|nr:TetR/AcrR family transcriptional regulator [Phenylobacterium sp.]HZZ70297.1 TetR/AcrR family transcriptional regulator [Phenylobacterium sp.]
MQAAAVKVTQEVKGAASRRSRTSGRRTQEERSAETRRRLIDAGLMVLQESGYANLTISKVTQRAGVTNGAMQHHFPSRDDLLLALLDAVYPILQIPFEAIGLARLPARERLSRLVDELWAIYSRPVYLAVWDIALGARGDPKLWARVSAYQKDITTRMRAEFVALFADLDPQLGEAERILAFTVSQIRGVAFLSMFGAAQAGADFSLIKDVAYEQLVKCARASAG